MALNLECSSTRLLNGNILRLVILLLYVVAVVALKAPGSYPGASCSTKPDHALQTPQTEWTHLIVVRGTVLIFGHRHRLVAGRENIPYATLATPNIFVQQLETHTIQRKISSQTQWLPRRSLLGQCPKRDHELPSGNVRAQSAPPSTAYMARHSITSSARAIASETTIERHVP